MPIFIKLNDCDRKLFFNSIKKEINCSWDNFYPRLNISRTMFFNYLSGRYAIPKPLFVRLENFGKIKIKDYGEFYQNKYIEKNPNYPKFNSRLAEILGVINGDGHISKINHEICVVGSILEEEYYHYLKKLFDVNLNFNLVPQDTTFKLRTYSKKIANHLNTKYSLPKGNKIGQLKIPIQVLSSEIYLKSYIRGLYDTDGSFYIRRKKDPVIEITSADPLFLNQVKEVLRSLGFNIANGQNRIFIYNKKHINRFFKEIKPANSKHLKKYQDYLKLYNAPVV